MRFIGPGERTAIPPFSDDDGKFILTITDELIEAFRPIEHLFNIMDKFSGESKIIEISQFAEIGINLSRNFRKKLESLYNIEKKTQ